MPSYNTNTEGGKQREARWLGKEEASIKRRTVAHARAAVVRHTLCALRRQLREARVVAVRCRRRKVGRREAHVDVAGAAQVCVANQAFTLWVRAHSSNVAAAPGAAGAVPMVGEARGAVPDVVPAGVLQQGEGEVGHAAEVECLQRRCGHTLLKLFLHGGAAVMMNRRMR